jgi:hypothetical protein
MNAIPDHQIKYFPHRSIELQHRLTDIFVQQHCTVGVKLQETTGTLKNKRLTALQLVNKERRS